MYSTCARKPERRAAGVAEEADRLGARLDEVGVAAETGEVARQRQAAAGVREDRVVDRVEHEARDDLADRPLAALPDQQRVLQERIAAQQFERVGRQLRQIVELDVAGSPLRGRKQVGSKNASLRSLTLVPS